MASATLPKQRVNSIDFFRFLCATMVVIGHLSFDETWGAVGYFLEHIYPMISVPFFLSVSGYFYIRSLENGDKRFTKQLKHILTVYSLWSMIYTLVSIILSPPTSAESLLVSLKKMPVTFLFYGYPYHFWYFPAVLGAIILTELFYKLGFEKALLPLSFALFTIGCLGCSYYKIGIQVPLLRALYRHEEFITVRRILLTGFPFFSSGYLLLRLEKGPLTGKHTVVLWLVSVLVFMGELLFVRRLGLARVFQLTFGLYLLLIATMLLLLRYPMPQYGSRAASIRSMANMTYYAHPLLQLLLSVGSYYMGIRFPDAVMFVVMVVVPSFTGWLCHGLLQKGRWRILRYFVG